MSDTTQVMLTHLQSRITEIEALHAKTSAEYARLSELELMRNVLSAANKLQQLAEPTRMEKLIAIDKACDGEPTITFAGKSPE